MENKENISIPEESVESANERLVRQFLINIGENPDRPGLVDTPKRVAKMWEEIFRGYNEDNRPKITCFLNGEDGITVNQMITDEGDFYSHCEHHVVPFFGRYKFAYIPNPKGMVLGLSKVARIVDYYSAKLQIQERLVQEIVDELWDAITMWNIDDEFNMDESKHIRPIAMGIWLEGEHLCKTMRGAKKKGKMTTTYLKGKFLEDHKTKEEFINFVSRGN